MDIFEEDIETCIYNCSSGGNHDWNYGSKCFCTAIRGFWFSIRGGEVLSFELDSENTSLLISIDARARGELIITLPRAIIDAKIGS